MKGPEYLSDQWFDDAAARVAATTISSPSQDPISFSYEVTELPQTHSKAGSVVRYRIDVDPGGGTATLSQAREPGDVTFSMTYEVAFNVASNAISGSRAFLDGSIRLGGDVAALIERADELKELSGVIGAGDA